MILGLLLYFGSSSDMIVPIKEQHMFYGQARILKIEKENLEWKPIFEDNEALETTEKKDYIVQHVRN